MTSSPRNITLIGDVRKRLAELSPSSVDTVITSPPYFGVRNYGHDQQLGAEPSVDDWVAELREGCREVDRPGSTCPLNLLPPFQRPEALFPGYAEKLDYAPGDFPNAEAIHRNTLKLPVWHREEDRPLVDKHIDAFRKSTDNYRDLLG